MIQQTDYSEFVYLPSLVDELPAGRNRCFDSEVLLSVQQLSLEEHMSRLNPVTILGKQPKDSRGCSPEASPSGTWMRPETGE